MRLLFRISWSCTLDLSSISYINEVLLLCGGRAGCPMIRDLCGKVKFFASVPRWVPEVCTWRNTYFCPSWPSHKAAQFLLRSSEFKPIVYNLENPNSRIRNTDKLIIDIKNLTYTCSCFSDSSPHFSFACSRSDCLPFLQSTPESHTFSLQRCGCCWRSFFEF